MMVVVLGSHRLSSGVGERGLLGMRGVSSRARLAVVLVMVLVAGLVAERAGLVTEEASAAGPPPPPPFSCIRNGLLLVSYLPRDYQSQAPDLINPLQLVPGLELSNGLYGATDAQRAALGRLQSQATTSRRWTERARIGWPPPANRVGCRWRGPRSPARRPQASSVGSPPTSATSQPTG